MRIVACVCFLVLVVTSIMIAGISCQQECTPDPTYNPSINPADFVAGVDNPLFPLVPGTRYVYHGDGETTEVTVTNDTKEIVGVTAIVVRDVVSVGGEIIEDTYDWYAQDKESNVWYLGEDTKEYEDGQLVSTAGSWEAGVDGAKPGIIMHGTQPAIGVPYRQEYYACKAEDWGEVASLNESVTVPYGSFDDCLQTREFSALEPGVSEYKYYALGIGLVLEVDVQSGARMELIEVTTV
jgi:hypothetical protein